MRRILCLIIGHAYPLNPEWLPVNVTRQGHILFYTGPFKYRYCCPRCKKVTDGPVLSRWQ